MSAHPPEVLLVEDNPGDARLILEYLRESGDAFHLTWVQSVGEGVARLDAGPFDVVLLDLFLPDSQGLATFERIHQAHPTVPIVVLSGLADEEVAVAAVRSSAQDYLMKGRVDEHLLARAIRYAIERQNLVVENARLYQQAQEAIRVRDMVLSSVAHDLRAPLTPIKLVGETLRWQIEQADVVDRALILEGLTSIDTNVERIAAQIDELLDVARLQMGREVHLQRRRTDLVALVRSQVAEFQTRTRRHQVRVEAQSDKLIVWIDAPRIERVLGNLLSNALKYSPNGGEVVVRVRKEGGADEDWAIVEVQDPGIGMSAADRDRLFTWFFRSERVAEIAGTGIGLAGASRIVQLHGGNITVQSVEGMGSTFTVRLPLGPPRLEEPRDEEK